MGDKVWPYVTNFDNGWIWLTNIHGWLCLTGIDAYLTMVEYIWLSLTMCGCGWLYLTMINHGYIRGYYGSVLKFDIQFKHFYPFKMFFTSSCGEKTPTIDMD